MFSVYARFTTHKYWFIVCLLLDCGLDQIPPLLRFALDPKWIRQWILRTHNISVCKCPVRIGSARAFYTVDIHCSARVLSVLLQLARADNRWTMFESNIQRDIKNPPEILNAFITVHMVGPRQSDGVFSFEKYIFCVQYRFPITNRHQIETNQNHSRIQNTVKHKIIQAVPCVNFENTMSGCRGVNTTCSYIVYS